MDSEDAPQARHQFSVPAEVATALRKVALEHRTTPHVVLLTAFHVVLARYTNETDLVVGTTVAGRVVLVRADLSGDPPFPDAVLRVRDAMSRADHDSAIPLHQKVFVLDSSQIEHYGIDLYLSMVSTTSGLAGTLAHDPTTAGSAMVGRLADHFGVLLAGIASAPARRISEPPLLTEAEHHRQVVVWNDTAAPRPHRPAHALVAAQAAAHPDAVAVTDGARELSYVELDERAARLAGVLRAHGVGPEVPVAVCLPRSPELVIGILGVLKAGGAYVPVDPDYPAERVEHILRDCAAPVVLTDTEIQRRLPAGPQVVRIDRDVPATAPVLTDVSVEPANLAYVIYTSGSTGRPKGVTVPHAGLANLVAWHLDRYGVGQDDQTTQVAAAGFDASVWEIWPTLAAGATLHIVGDDERMRPDALLAWLAARRITISFLPTPLAQEVLRLEPPPGLALRVLLTGGDKLGSRPRADAPYTVVNHYGPTEASVVTTAAPVPIGTSTAPPIGRPIDNLRAYVLDPALSPVPVGVTGELYVAGVGLARGYLGAPGQTAARFVPDPFATTPGGRLYRTGDLVRQDADGVIEFVGRADDQLKIRGFRVEPGEVEARLREHPAVHEALVTARGHTHLTAYVTGAVDPDDLRAYLAARLPDHLVPAFFVPVDRFPRSPNGKVDLAALPDPVVAATGPAPLGPVEELVAMTWAEVLDLPIASIGGHDNFFVLGGHSLLAGQVITRVNALFDLDLTVQALFRAATVAAFAAEVERAGGERVAVTARLTRQIDELSDEDVERLLTEQSGAQLRPPGGESEVEGAR